ncbi:MAG: helix-turn-helix domain-containing protein [Clostridia bacterium]|nr:helix-turn-helix domain-containing protein [Clostridia bacterium]
MNKIEAPHIDMKKTGEQISSLRKLNGLSIKQLQECLGLATPQAIYKWEHGLNLPSIDNLLFLSWIFNVNINSIIVCSNITPQERIFYATDNNR